MSLATVQVSPSAAAAARASAFSMSAPSNAAIAPIPTGTAACIARPRSLSSAAVTDSGNAPAAQSAVYSPKEWPATKSHFSDKRTPPSVSSTRKVAMALAIIAGCAFSVRVSSLSGPSHIRRNRCWPSASSISSNTARAIGLASASALPMPTAWLPCPGKINARITAPVGPCLSKVAYGAALDVASPNGTMRLSAS